MGMIEMINQTEAFLWMNGIFPFTPANARGTDFAGGPWLMSG